MKKYTTFVFLRITTAHFQSTFPLVTFAKNEQLFHNLHTNFPTRKPIRNLKSRMTLLSERSEEGRITVNYGRAKKGGRKLGTSKCVDIIKFGCCHRRRRRFPASDRIGI